MGARISLRDDFDGIALRRLSKRCRDGAQTRRLLALAEIYEGARRTEAARIGGVTLQIVWFEGSGNCPGDSLPDGRVIRFNAEGPDGLINRKAAGPKRKLDDAQRQALADIVERGPIPAIHEVVRWRRCDLAQWIWEEFGISLSEATVGRELRALGFRKISARPRHYAQNELAIDDFKKTSPSGWQISARASRPERR